MEGLQVHPRISRQKCFSMGQSPYLTPAILHIVSAGYLCWGYSAQPWPGPWLSSSAHTCWTPYSLFQDKILLLSFLSQLPLPAGKRELSVAKLTSGVQEARCDKNTGHLGNMAKHKQHKLCMEIPSLEGQARGQNSSHSPGEFPSAQTQTGSTPKSFLDADNSNSALLLMNQDWHSAPCHQRRSSGEN